VVRNSVLLSNRLAEIKLKHTWFARSSDLKKVTSELAATNVIDGRRSGKHKIADEKGTYSTLTTLVNKDLWE
jgi:hypothetical protein